MILDINTLDCAIEWLLPKIGTKQETVINEENGEKVDVISALCVWCLRLRYKLVEHNRNGINSDSYPAWSGYRYIASSNLYKTVKEMAKLYRVNGGVAPDYGIRNHKNISKWTYKRVFGPDVFNPIQVNVEELWQAVQRSFPDIIKRQTENVTNQIDNDFLMFEMCNKELANVLETIGD